MVNIMCILAAACFLAGNAMRVSYYIEQIKSSNFDENQYLFLDSDYIQIEWGFRIENKSKYLSTSILNTLAWFFLMFPIIQLAWVLSERGTKWISLHGAIAICVLAGSLTEWISHVLYIGASMASELLAREFNLDNWIADNSQDGIGWKTLEVMHIVTFGFISSIGAIEWLFLSIIMLLICVSVKNWSQHVDSTTFGNWWNGLGLFVAFLSILEFVFEMLRLNSFNAFAELSFWYSTVNRLVFIPTWLVLLGLRLPYATAKLKLQDVTSASEQSAFVD